MAILETVKEHFADNIQDVVIVNPKRVYIEIKPDYLRMASEYLFKQLELRFAIATGIDEKDYMEILYHFSYDKEGVFINLKVKLDKKKPVVDTIADIITGAKWIEREMHELLGIEFTGNDDMRFLLLSPDYKGRQFPLRKNV